MKPRSSNPFTVVQNFHRLAFASVERHRRRIHRSPCSLSAINDAFLRFDYNMISTIQSVDRRQRTKVGREIIQHAIKVSVIKNSKIVKVLLDWTDKEHDLFDANYLKDLPMVHKPGVTVKKTKQESISLFSCLDAFLKEEPLGPDDMWYCPGCKEHRQATKKLDLWRLPDIIVFHLNRFSYSQFLKNKLDTFVNFPSHNLDLSKYVKSEDMSSGSNVYDLYAISNHYGGLGSGHYSAYVKVMEQQWESHLKAMRIFED
ncbi:hypothetical protein L2E82_01934 [Cichorium intybus]|uniref:Uncharacterized protein n=1 Tax=Cichorium intybus TaxID=13427 RepID=A0ACB9H1J4_CICIN|nr:hypothetical protein L2E82_01934 [Cichorium intybus]